LRDKNENGKQINIAYQLEVAESRVRVRVNEQHPLWISSKGATRTINAVVSGDLLFGDNGREVETYDILNGWDIFVDPDEYDIRILINAGYTDISVQQRMIQLCEDRRDCIPTLHVPVDYQTGANFVEHRRNLLHANTSFGTLYGPDILEVTDEGQKIYVPCSGAVA